MTAMRFPAGGNLWRTQNYYPWKEPQNGGMLASLKVGLSEGGGERLSRAYVYNGFGDITSLTEGTTGYSFTYDGLGRLTSAYGRSYSYDAANRLTSFNAQTYGYGDSGPHHAVDRIGNADRFDYDANGNMTVRNKGLAGQQTLVWDAQNRLPQVQDNNGDLLEQYWYDVDGARVKKVSGTTTTYTFFAHYEEEVTGAVTTTVSHYSFGGLRVAVKRGSDLYHLHGDHLGSISLTTDDAGDAAASRAYYAYGAERSSSGDLQTDRTFTRQKSDATGLMYYNARYYDRALGTFISPDSLVPKPTNVLDHNRFLYARGNPLKYADPSGNSSGRPVIPVPISPLFALMRKIFADEISVPDDSHNLTQQTDTDAPLTMSPIDSLTESISQSFQQIKQGLQDMSEEDISQTIDRYIPPGATSIGATISGGPVGEFVFDTGLFIDKSGNVSLTGRAVGVAATTGGNYDRSVYVQNFPTASSIDVFEGWGGGLGVSAGQRAGGGIELNATQDSASDKNILGFTLYAGSVARANFPFPLVKFYVNATYTELHNPRFNIYDICNYSAAISL